MDEQIKWYEVKKRNNIRTPHKTGNMENFINLNFHSILSLNVRKRYHLINHHQFTLINFV